MTEEAEEAHTGRYSIGQFLRSTPEKISGGLVVCLNAAATAEWIDISTKSLGAINIITLTVLTLLYVTPNVSSNVKLSALKKSEDEKSLNSMHLGEQLARRPLRAEDH